VSCGHAYDVVLGGEMFVSEVRVGRRAIVGSHSAAGRLWRTLFVIGLPQTLQVLTLTLFTLALRAAVIRFARFVEGRRCIRADL